MKKSLLKSILCFALAGSLFFGEAGVALASDAKSTQKSEEAVVLETTDSEVKTGETVELTEITGNREDTTKASVDYVYAYRDYNWLYYSFNGYGSKFEVYVNNKLIDTIDNERTEDVYDEETGDWIGTRYIPAPEYSTYGVSVYIPFQAGASYTLKIVAYTYDGTTYTKGGSKSAEALKFQFPKVNQVSVSTSTTGAYDENGLTTGYNKFYGAYLYIDVETDDYVTTNYQIQRKTGSKGSWKTIATCSGTYDMSYTDTTAQAGTTYYYRVRPVVVKDDYVAAKNSSNWTTTDKFAAGKPSVTTYVYYGEEGVIVEAYDAELASGFEVYRSTKKSSGYKKIATISDNYYIDKSVKSGTYYYKLKPFYYDTAAKKKIYGDLSDPKGVKIVMSYLYAGVQQTGANKAKIEWEKVKGASVYEIYMKSDVAGDAYKYVGSTTKLSYTVSNLESDGFYYFKVRACKTANDIKSYYQSYTTSLQMGFHAPRSLAAVKRTVSIKNSTMTAETTLKWNRVYGAKKYRVEAYDNTKDKWVVLKTITKTTTTSYTVKNTKTLNNSWKYSNIRVYAVNGSQEEYAYLYGAIDRINMVTNAKAKKNSATSAKVSWDKSTGADMYRVYRISPTGYTYFLGTTTKAYFVDKKLTPGVNYTYYVEAYNEKYGVSAENVSDGKEPTYYTTYNHKMTAPKISSVKNSASKKATITWGKAAYATKYIVYRSTSKSGKYTKVGTTDKLTYTDTKLTKGKTYYYKVVAQTTNDAGITVESALSAAKSVKITK